MGVQKAKIINTENTIINNGTTTQSTVATQPAKAGVIPIGQQGDGQSNPIVDFINTPEFKNLSPEVQLQQLKQKFPDVDESVLKAAITAVMTTVETEKPQEVELSDEEQLALLNNRLAAGEQLSEEELKQKEILENKIKYAEAKEKAKDLPQEQTADFVIANEVAGKDKQEKLDNYINQKVLNGRDLSEISEDEKFEQIAKAKEPQLAKAIAEKLGIDFGNIVEPPKTEELSILEQFAQQLQQTGKKDVSIDDVVSFLRSIPEDKRTPDQQKALKYIETFSAQDVKQLSKEQIVNLLKDNSQELENLIPEEVKNSPEWKQKSPTEKMAARADAILEKILPGYSKLPEGDSINGKVTPGSKADIRQRFYEKVGEAIIPDWNKKTQDEKNFEIEKIAIAIDVAESANVPFSELLDPEKGPKIMKKVNAKYGMDTILAKFTNDPSIDPTSKEWISETGSKKVEIIADSILESIDKNYKNLSADEKNKKREQWVDLIAQQLYPDWKNLTPSEKETRKELFATELSVIKKLGISPSDYFTMSVETRLEHIQIYERATGIDKNFTPEQKLQRETMIRLAKSGRIHEGAAIGVTYQDMFDTLNEKIKNGEKLSPDELKEYQKLEHKIKWYKIAKHKNISPEDSADFKIKKMQGKDNNEKVDNYIDKYILKGRKVSELSQEELKEAIAMAVDPKLAKILCSKLGLDPNIYMTDVQNIEQATNGIVEGNINDVNEANGRFHASGKSDFVNATTNAVYNSPELAKDPEKLNSYNVNTANLSSQYIPTITQNINNTDLISTDMAVELGRRFATSNETSDANKAMFTQSLVETASSDTIKGIYGEELSKTGVASVLEGLAAASNSIQDQNIRSQYNSHVEKAASNLPPEQQSTIKTAMQTGQISKETLSKTNSTSSNPSAQQTSQNADKNNPTTQRQGSAQPAQTTQTTSRSQAQQVTAQQTAQQTVQLRQQNVTNPTSFASTPTSTSTSATTPTSASTSATTPTFTSTSASTTSYTSYTTSTAPTDETSVTGYTKAEAQAIAQSDEAKRQELMQKVQDLKDEIDESVKEWEARHRKLTTEEGDIITAGVAIDAVVDAINSSSYSQSDKDELIQRVYNASSIDEIYEILVSKSVSVTNIKEKVLDLLGTSGSGTSVRNVVAEVIGDDSVVKELFIRSSSSSVKKELLNLMSPDTVVELLASKQISNIADVDHKILRTFLEKNIYSMSNTEFNEYLKHLPLDDRMALVEMRNNARGVTSRMQVPQGENHSADMPSLTPQDEQLAPQPNQGNSPLAKGEMSRTLADGSVVTRQGSGFGAISDTDFDTYQIIKPDKKQDGAPIGMDDEVLTVGSPEWNRKYNNNNVQATAFTMSSFDDEDEELGMNFGSVKGNFKGSKIRKKGRLGGFNAMG